MKQKCARASLQSEQNQQTVDRKVKVTHEHLLVCEHLCLMCICVAERAHQQSRVQLSSTGSSFTQTLLCSFGVLSLCDSHARGQRPARAAAGGDRTAETCTQLTLGSKLM